MKQGQKNWINTEQFSNHLRKRSIQKGEKKILITSFYGSEQKKDLTKAPNCEGFGRIKHFRRKANPNWPTDPLPIDPARKKIKINSSDDVQAQVFQLGACNWRCWYCFVDFPMLSADMRHSDFLTSDYLISLYLKERNPPKIIDLSGGHPGLVPEWTLWMMRALKRKGLENETYLWTDDNLSVDYIRRYLRNEDIELIKSYNNYGRVGCFKGYDKTSFSFNTNADPKLFDSQFKIMQQIVALGLDVYGYATFTTPTISDLKNKMKAFVDRLQGINKYFPLRVVPLEIHTYNSNRHRIDQIHKKAIVNQYEAVSAWSFELERRFTISELQMNISEIPIYSKSH